VQDELIKNNIKTPIAFVDTASTLPNSGKLGLLLYAQTTKGHRIAVTIEFEVFQGNSAKFLDQVKLYGVEIVHKLEAELAHGGLVDEHLADQLIIFMALSTSCVSNSNKYLGADKQRDGSCMGRRCEVLAGPLTPHTETAMRIAETMLGDIVFSTKRHKGIGMVVTCEHRLATGAISASRDTTREGTGVNKARE
jgi:hypothetical protein